MPAAFNRLAAQPGARIRTVKPTKGTYMHIVYGEGGESAAGEVKQKKGGKRPPPKPYGGRG